MYSAVPFYKVSLFPCLLVLLINWLHMLFCWWWTGPDQSNWLRYILERYCFFHDAGADVTGPNMAIIQGIQRFLGTWSATGVGACLSQCPPQSYLVSHCLRPVVLGTSTSCWHKMLMYDGNRHPVAVAMCFLYSVLLDAWFVHVNVCCFGKRDPALHWDLLCCWKHPETDDIDNQRLRSLTISGSRKKRLPDMRCLGWS